MRKSVFIAALAAFAVAGPRLDAQDSAAAVIPVDRIVAVVGDKPILWSDIGSWIAERRASGLRVPPDSAGQMELARRALDELVNEELLVQFAVKEKVEASDAEVAAAADRQVRRLREQLGDENRFRDELRKAGFGTPEEYRRMIMEEARRTFIVQKLLDKLRQEGRMAGGAVSEADVTRMFEENRTTLPRRPATVTFRQVVIAPKPSAAARRTARLKADSLLVELRGGADFEQVARRESMDETTREIGGDLGWNRRGLMYRDFDDMMFAIPPGATSPVVETPFGFHIIKVDRVKPGEVKARHILIRPRLDSTDVARARQEADSVMQAWRAGAPFDTLVARHNDPVEYTLISDPQEREKLPPSYATAFEGKGDDDITEPFPIDNPGTGVPKFVVAQILKAVEGGEYTVEDLRETIRAQLVQEKAMRRLIEGLRRDSYVSIRI